MSKVIRRRWETTIGGMGIPRRDRRSCEYEAYVPDTICDRQITLAAEIAADISDAERAITKLNAEASSLVNTEALARLLLRAESVASSRIEGLEIGARRILRAEAAMDLGEGVRDVSAVEVLGNIRAMVGAVATVTPGRQLVVDDLLGFHKELFIGTRAEASGGIVRTLQNWIGGSDYNPCSASFVPPPPEYVNALLSDLVDFCNQDSLPAVAQAALAHAQFETIHPFADGNGRTGRALIHMVLRRRGLIDRVLLPVSLVLATQMRDYIGGLEAYRYRGPATSHAAEAGINLWIGRFAAACSRAVTDTEAFETKAKSIETGWRESIGSVRGNSSTDLILSYLPGVPILTAAGAASLIGRTYKATNAALGQLVEGGVLRQTTIGRRNRVFEAPAIIEAFTALERQLASPAGDTRQEPPVRRVPGGVGGGAVAEKDGLLHKGF